MHISYLPPSIFLSYRAQAAAPTRTITATPGQLLIHSQTPPPKGLGTPTLEDASDLEELEIFSKAFKQRRIRLGFTQVWPRDSGLASAVIRS